MDVTGVTNASINDKPDKKNDDDDAIDRALEQMSSIYKSRCIQPPHGSNVTIREIKKDV
jgi:hypothetical protein